MKVNIRSMLIGIGLIFYGVAAGHAAVVSFGTGPNQFSMEFVTIGNPGNTADTTGAPNPSGAVAYTYGMGKFEVSEDMINKFNASQSLQITKDTRGPNKPATSVSWNEAARFVNWLNTSTGGHAAYNFTTGGVNDNIEVWTTADTLDYDATNPYRSKRAKYVLPSYNEWYKAAFYDPTDSTYYDFPNGSNTAPVAVTNGTAVNTAVYANAFAQGPADVDQAGGLSPSGVMGLGGNILEWEESAFNLVNIDPLTVRGIRGGHWNNGSDHLLSSTRYGLNPSEGDELRGFRVASLFSSTGAVPEPSMMVIGTLFGLGGLVAKRRMKK